ncbi:VOC family protein [Litchfieldia alkalitelluris]|uniref:VOC family protein n=1 Tax=Litchfieldia alkalitelluris TaxID=304268 RepID=UPI0009962806|nr:VOC family protein [Litchfieldia alkalitelluris]
MTTLNWDHTVHYVNDLDKVIRTFEEHGLIAFHGGSHTQWGTYNVLSYFGLNYIEFLGIEDIELALSITDPNEVVKDAITSLPDQEVLSRVAISTNDIDATVEKLKEHNLKVSPIMQGKRRNAQGQLIEWKMVTIQGDFQGLKYPFIIQWKGHSDERIESLTASGIIREHPAGKVEVEKAVFYVTNPAAVVEHWRSLLGLTENTCDKLPNSIKVDNFFFEFKEGNQNQLNQLIFSTNSPHLQGKSIKVGGGEYTFNSST